MKVLLIHQAFRTASEGGGTRHFELLSKWVESGHEAVVIASDVSYLDGEKSTTQESGADGGIDIRRVKMYRDIHRSFAHRLLGFVSFMASSFAAGLRAAGDADVVMGTSPSLFQAFSAWAVAFLRRKPFLLEIRDLWPDFAIEMGVLKNPVMIFLARRLECFLYRRASRILVNSPAFITYLTESRGISKSKIAFVPNGVDSAMFDPAETGQSFRDAWGTGDRFVVLYAGAIGPANEITTMVRSAQILKDQPEIQWILIGDGKDRKRVTALIEELELENIHWHGVIGKNDMKQVLAAADACVAILQDVPMFKTVYPNKVFDYMAAGRPTVLAIDGVIREVIDESKGGVFVPPGNPDLLADAVVALSQDRDEARQMGKRARDYVGEHFDRGQHADEFRELVLGMGPQQESNRQ